MPSTLCLIAQALEYIETYEIGPLKILDFCMRELYYWRSTGDHIPLIKLNDKLGAWKQIKESHCYEINKKMVILQKIAPNQFREVASCILTNEFFSNFTLDDLNYSNLVVKFTEKSELEIKFIIICNEKRKETEIKKLMITLF